MPTVVLPGLGGAQQRAVADAFAAAGWTVRGTRREPGPGDDAMPADLETGAGLDAAFAGADVVAFTVPQDHRPGAMLRMAEAAARTAGAVSVARIVVNMAGRTADDDDAAVYASMRAVRDVFLGGPVPAVILEPTVFMDNLIAPWSLPGILGGTLAYPAAPDTRIAWISHRTLAQAVVAAATADEEGAVIDIGGPEALSGHDLARVLSTRLGRPMDYAAIPLDAFAAGLNAAFGPPAGDRIAELYGHLARHPDAMADGAEGLARLGVAPESLADFVARNRWS